MPYPTKAGSRLGIFTLALVALLIGAGNASAAIAPGGVGAQASVAVADVTCLKQCVDTHKTTPGGIVKVRGVAMEQVNEVVFASASGPLQVEPLKRTEGAATAVVPKGAIASRPYVIDSGGKKSARSPHKLFILPKSAIPSAIYPIRGPHEVWEGLGGGRGHQGADIGAACGTPLVAALPGKIQYRSYQARAGNYVVIDLNGSEADIAYMHMVAPASVHVGQTVTAGQPVGNVGETGNASGCHLHFEYWGGDIWQSSPLDPLPILAQWDAES